MDQEQFAGEVSKIADLIMDLQGMYIPAMIICACIEAACNIAIEHGKVKMVADNLRRSADHLEARLATN